MKMLVIAVVLVAAGGQKGGGGGSQFGWGWGVVDGEEIGIGNGDTYGYAGEGV